MAGDFIAPKYVENLNSTQPEKTASMSRLEGWTLMSFFVDKEGVPTHIEVIDGLANDRFLRKAIRHLSNLRYSPAVYDGNPVLSADTFFFRTDTSFRWSANDGISGGFKTYYNEADNYLLDGDIEKARESLLKLKEDHAKNLTEQALSAWLQSKFYFKQQNWPAYGKAVMTAHNLNQFMPEEFRLKSIQNSLKWHMFKREFSDAIYVLRQLRDQSEGAFSESDYQSAHKEIVKHIKSNPTNTIDVSLVDEMAWQHRLPRSTIGLNVQSGEIKFAELRCENGHQSFNSFPIADFAIPDDYMKCRFFVKGSLGTQFAFTEQGSTRAY